jgi:hypothetical protein
MDDFMTLCLLGMFVLIGFMLLSRVLGSFGRGGGGYGGYPGGGVGTERPTYDDPDVESYGGFGGGRRTNRRPWGGGGGFLGGGRSGGGFFGGGRRAGGGRTDSPNVRGRGGFGRDR